MDPQSRLRHPAAPAAGSDRSIRIPPRSRSVPNRFTAGASTPNMSAQLAVKAGSKQKRKVKRKLKAIPLTMPSRLMSGSVIELEEFPSLLEWDEGNHSDIIQPSVQLEITLCDTTESNRNAAPTSTSQDDPRSNDKDKNAPSLLPSLTPSEATREGKKKDGEKKKMERKIQDTETPKLIASSPSAVDTPNRSPSPVTSLDSPTTTTAAVTTTTITAAPLHTVERVMSNTGVNKVAQMEHVEMETDDQQQTIKPTKQNDDDETNHSDLGYIPDASSPSIRRHRKRKIRKSLHRTPPSLRLTQIGKIGSHKHREGIHTPETIRKRARKLKFSDKPAAESLKSKLSMYRNPLSLFSHTPDKKFNNMKSFGGIGSENKPDIGRGSTHVHLAWQIFSDSKQRNNKEKGNTQVT